MSKIVNGGKSDKHIIKPYQFKSLDDLVEKEEEFKSFSEINAPKEEPLKEEVKESKETSEVVHSLLQKIEELSNNFVKAQMEFEKKINECHLKIEEERKKAYEEGYQKGLNEAKEKYEAEFEVTKKLFEDSVKKLEEINKIFEKKLESIEKELVSVALDIAKEVIQSEVSEKSEQIALNLAKSLMKELKDASKVTIKVNPKDAAYLKENVKGIEIKEDEAVKPGGIVIISDIGNIDGDIEERFNTVKKAIQKSRAE